MNYAKIGYKIACWSLMIGGVGHTTMSVLSPLTPKQLSLIQTMKEFSIQAMGTETNIYSFHQGFSLMMGLLLFSYGLLNLFILKNSKQVNLPPNILLLNSIVTLICTILSFKYFFIVPIALTGLAFLGFSYSFIKTKTA